jgi:hypothetical protein
MTPWMPPGLPAPAGGGEDDAALVIGSGPEAAAFVVWLILGRGIPAARVTHLPDPAPTPAQVHAAVTAAAPGPTGQRWVVVVGAEVPDLAALVALQPGPAVWWVDAWDAELPAAVPDHTAVVVAPGATPLALGALRGWADADRDGVTTTTELARWCASAAPSIPGVGPVPPVQVAGDLGRAWSRGAEPAPPLGLPAAAPIESVASAVSRAPGVKACFAEEFARGSLPGRVTLRFTVGPDGAARSIGLDEPAWRGSPLEACLADVLRAIPFPLASGATTIQYPFVLQ